MRPCNEMLQKTLDLVERMTRLADEGDAVREDDGCGVVFGIVRDAAFKIRRVVEKERDAHVRKGWWLPGEDGARGSLASPGVGTSKPSPTEKLTS
ncbi:MAG: hypothetical protein AB9873_03880 [Syntrophobacteraceae bacterium]